MLLLDLIGNYHGDKNLPDCLRKVYTKQDMYDAVFYFIGLSSPAHFYHRDKGSSFRNNSFNKMIRMSIRLIFYHGDKYHVIIPM